MAKPVKQKPEPDVFSGLPVVGELRDCRQVSDSYWQGIYCGK
jgi:hypothetical protein